jgi:DNA-binding protein HU-beta
MAGKFEIIDTIAEHAGISKRDAASAYEAFLHAVTSPLRAGERVNVAGLGSFSVSERAARQGRNPKTGEPIQIAASRNVKFKAGKELKELVNSKAAS